MKHFDISSIVKSANNYISKNKPQICVGTGIALSIGSSIWAVWGTMKAIKKTNGKKYTILTKLCQFETNKKNHTTYNFSLNYIICNMIFFRTKKGKHFCLPFFYFA